MLNETRATLLHVLTLRAERESAFVRPFRRVSFDAIRAGLERLAHEPVQRDVRGACERRDLDKLLGLLPSVERERAEEQRRRRNEQAARRRRWARIEEEQRVTDVLAEMGDGMRFYELAAAARFEDPERVLRILKRLAKAGDVVDKGERGWFRAGVEDPHEQKSA